jgi:hypothetical protein
MELERERYLAQVYLITPPSIAILPSAVCNQGGASSSLTENRPGVNSVRIRRILIFVKSNA